MSSNNLRDEKQNLSSEQIEKLALHNKRAYQQDCPCANCGEAWMAHKGLLCPIREGYISPLVLPGGERIIVPPAFGTKTFIPDEKYYDKNPNFAVQ